MASMILEASHSVRNTLYHAENQYTDYFVIWHEDV